MNADVTARLAEALEGPIHEASWATGVAMLDSDVAAFRNRLAAALLPVVDAIAEERARQRAAEELEAAANGAVGLNYGVVPASYLRTIATALRGGEGR